MAPHRKGLLSGFSPLILCLLFLNTVKSSYVIDGLTGTGRVFDGIGGLSGGGVRMTGSAVIVLVSLSLLTSSVNSDRSRWLSLELPEEHVPYFFYNNPALKTACAEDNDCPYKNYVNVTRCWGYEEKPCKEEERMQSTICKDEPNGWVQTKEKQKQGFWEQADFGHLGLRLSSMKTICEPQESDDSFLACSDNTRYCYVKNLYIDLAQAKLRDGSSRYRNDLLPEKGLIGGKCKLNKKLLQERGDHKSFLQSWASELEHFTELDFHPIKDKKCDYVFEKPTVIFKLDAGINMYHHFCDFVNLYMSQHMNNSFDRDIQILNWDTGGYGQYGDLFADTWKAFTKHPIIMLQKYNGKKICFKNAMMPLLARQRLGLFYNTPIMPGCYGTGMFRAFSQHVLHRLGIEQDGPLENKIRVTLLSRGTKYRNILNEKEIVNALKTVGLYEVKVVDYKDYSFPEQMKITYNSDVFMGMHGAGLTHLLFLPDWASIFEIYNCEDKNCYYDLARLRGTKYLTWENMNKLQKEDEETGEISVVGHHPTLGAHAKFTNYELDVKEFMRMVEKTVSHVQTHPAFKAAWEKKFGGKYETRNKDEL